MGATRPVVPVKLFCGIIAGDEVVAADAVEALRNEIGEVDAESEAFAFDFADYYAAEMGEGLFRRFVSFAALGDPDALPDLKLEANALEARFSGPAGARRVNLDPGYLTAAKLVLATTKDFSHRLYLRDGVYAEVTLNFRKSSIVCHEWTFPDFGSGVYTGFLLSVRRRYMAQVAADGE